MKLLRIVLLLIAAAFAVAAAEANENEIFGEGEELSEGDELGGEVPDQIDDVDKGEESPEDGEGDGQPAVALSEVQIQNLLKKIDSDGDGKASLDEFKLFAKKSDLLETRKSFDEQYPAETFTVKTIHEHLEEFNNHDADELEHNREKLLAADANKDGKLDNDEYFHFYAVSKDVLDVEAKRSLKGVDANEKDGLIDLDEFLTFRLGGPSVGELDDALEREKEKTHFAVLDKDGNEKLSVEEWMPYVSFEHHSDMDSANLVESSDRNKDGHLDLEELVKSAEYPLFEMWARTHSEL